MTRHVGNNKSDQGFTCHSTAFRTPNISAVMAYDPPCALCRFVWANYDPEQDKWQEGLPVQISRTLKRRYFLVEKAKNANVVGEPKRAPVAIMLGLSRFPLVCA